MDRDSIVFVAEDLVFLRDQWHENITDPDIRRGTAVLRRLLVEDAYGNTWRAIGQAKEPRLIAVDLLKLLGTVPPERVEAGLAGGAHFRGVHLAGLLLCKGAHPPDGAPGEIRRDGYPGEREYFMSEFLSSPAGFSNGHPFSRRDVIKYIANVKGGVHLSVQQRNAEQKLVARFAKIEKKLTVHTTDSLLVECVAIGQALGRSRDAGILIDAADKI